MCGFFTILSPSARVIDAVCRRQNAIEQTIRRRGPDNTGTYRGTDIFALHTLLSMTGPVCSQPVVDDGWILMFNGEIYNDYLDYTDTYGDTHYLAERLKAEGVGIAADLDGEFAICCVDRVRRQAHLVSDPMGTKPLYYQLGRDFVVAGSYASTVAAAGVTGAIRQVRANTRVTVDLRDYSCTIQKNLRPFDFSHQSTDTFERWNAAFSESIRKRTQNSRRRCFVSLSAGHDSGLIAAELLHQNVPFAAYMSPFKEDPDILRARRTILEGRNIPVELIEPAPAEFERMRQRLHEHCEYYALINTESEYQHFRDPDVRNNPGFVVYAIIHEKARAAGRLISLSGQGGDEVYSDYFNEHSRSRLSELRGDWNKADVPWKNFNQGWNRVLIGGNERIAGAFGVETRYPLLDWRVVQEFLNLRPDLKAKTYKAPLTQRLRALHFPHHMRKQGFAGADVAVV